MQVTGFTYKLSKCFTTVFTSIELLEIPLRGFYMYYHVQQEIIVESYFCVQEYISIMQG